MSGGSGRRIDFSRRRCLRLTGAEAPRGLGPALREALARLAGFFPEPLRPSAAQAADYLAGFEAGDWRGSAADKGRGLVDGLLLAGLLEGVEVRRGAAPVSEARLRRQQTLDIAVHAGTRRGAPSLRSIAAKGAFGHSLCANWCGACGRDTPHRGYLCLACGATDAPRVAVRKRRPSLGYRRGLARVGADRRAAAARRAEESRRKWEGGP